MFLPLGYLSQYIFGSLLFLLSLFIIRLILLQRGKGGGLTGALGRLGGQSAFGVKAGDLFTRITAVAVLLWIFVCALACRWYLPEVPDIEADLGSSTSIGSPSEVGAEIPGFDLSKQSTLGEPPAQVPKSESPSNSVPQNLPPAPADSGSQTPTPNATGTEPPATQAPKADTPKSEAPTPPPASGSPEVPAPSEKQP